MQIEVTCRRELTRAGLVFFARFAQLFVVVVWFPGQMLHAGRVVAVMTSLAPLALRQEAMVGQNHMRRHDLHLLLFCVLVRDSGSVLRSDLLNKLPTAPRTNPHSISRGVLLHLRKAVRQLSLSELQNTVVIFQIFFLLGCHRQTCCPTAVSRRLFWSWLPDEIFGRSHTLHLPAEVPVIVQKSSTYGGNMGGKVAICIRIFFVWPLACGLAPPAFMHL